MSSRFNVIEAEFGSFEINAGFIRLNWRYSVGNSDYKYCDGCYVSVDGQDALTLVGIMSKTALCCESSGNGLDILYSSGIPVAYRAKPSDGWSPISTGWHKSRLDEYFYERERRLND